MPLLVTLVLFSSVSRAATDLQLRVTHEADQAEMELNHLWPFGAVKRGGGGSGLLPLLLLVSRSRKTGPGRQRRRC